MDLFDAALAWHAAGCSVIPIRADGSKAPAVAWKRYQQERADLPQLEEWFGQNQHGIGVACGAISGGLELLEFEGRAVTAGLPAAMRELMDGHGQADLWAAVSTGYVETTPSGGLHLLYRVADADPRPNTKLARRPGDNNTVDVLIETRGEGGQVVVAPTPGPFHTSGRPWMTVLGNPETIPAITAEQRDMLHAVATLLDQMPAEKILPESWGAGPAPAPTSGQGLRPGDDYNQRTSWDDILLPAGWRKVRKMGAGWAWRRPGKDDPGISATTGQAADGVDRLYVFSTSTDLPAEKPLTKFAVHALLEHGGDYAAAARALKAAGFGERAAERPPVQVSPPPPPARHLAAVPTDGTTAIAIGDTPTAYPRLSDTGNAAALVDVHGDHLRYDCDRARWLVFADARWELQPPGGGEARELAKDVAMRMPVGDDKTSRWRTRSLSAVGVTATLTQAATDPRVVVHTRQLDADPYLLGTPGGVVDLRTAQLRPGRPEDLITRSTTVTPDFGPRPPIWADFLATTFNGDQELIGYVQRIFGLALIGEVLEQILPFFYGQGANGKSTLVDTAQALLGVHEGGYSITVPSEILMIRKHEGHTTELAQMAGRRLVVASELEDGQRLAEARIKLITGRDLISARFLFGQPFTFTPSHLTVLVGNHKPQITTGGPALWRRMAAVPFDHQVPAERRDPTLPQKLIAVGGHILAWMIDGARDYLNAGIRTPAAVTQATEEYEHDQDTVGRFWNERILVSPNMRISVTDVRSAYQKWCTEAGCVAVGANRLTQELARLGAGDAKSGSRRFYTGISLYADENEEDNGSVTGDWRDR